MSLSKSEITARIRTLGVLVIDDSLFMRRIVRNLLLNIGVKEVFEAGDGIAGLDAIRTANPDIVLLDWELPLLSGVELVRIVRSPGVFPTPDVPIIVLSFQGERRRVLEAMRSGVNEYLVKPVSAKSLYERFVSILAKPRPIVRVGDYYGPEPRRQFQGPDHERAPVPDEAPAY
jgi:DNA-binding response OmpR family regulator